jgi:hypothetical protein
MSCLGPGIDSYLSWAQFCGQIGGCTLLSVEKKNQINSKVNYRLLTAAGQEFPTKYIWS